MAHFFLLSFDQLINLFSLTDLHIPLQGIEAIQKIREKDFYNINLNEMSLQKLCGFFFHIFVSTKKQSKQQQQNQTSGEKNAIVRQNP